MGASVWKALSDDSRRHMLLLLKDKNMFPSELAEHFDMTLAGVSTHLRILRDADLVKERREGQSNRQPPLSHCASGNLSIMCLHIYHYNFVVNCVTF